jgi:hypothetical protein
MFNADFYPTPDELIRDLLALGVTGNFAGFSGIDRFTIKGRVLEPSAGKGNIIDYIRKRGKTIKIDAIENDAQLTNFLMGAGHTVVWSDFLTFETYREYNAIVMNPPFSADDKHLLHAIRLASKQITKDCEIYAIINAETIKNPFSVSRKELARLLDVYDARIEFVSDAFSTAERKTNVEVALVYIKMTRDDSSEELYRRTVDAVKETKSTSTQTGDISTALSTFVKYHEVQDRVDDITRLVCEYEQASQLTRDAYHTQIQKLRFLEYISNVNGGKLYTPRDGVDVEYEEELQRLRTTYWTLILRTDEFMQKLTTQARDKLSRQIEASAELEINMTNVYMLLHAIVANSSDMLVSSVVSMFEKITSFSRRDYSDNIHYYNGWNTNEAYKIGKKVIYPFFSPFGDWDMGSRDKSFKSVDYRTKEFILDLLKAFKPFREVNNEFEMLAMGDFENDVLRFKMFKKGTVHVWFKDLETLNKINYVCGRHFNWLPTDDDIQNDEKAREFVAKEFGDIMTDVSRLLTTKEDA